MARGSIHNAHKGKTQVIKALRWTAQIVQRLPRRRWAWLPGGAPLLEAPYYRPTCVQLLSRHRVVGTFAWPNQCRRLNEDYQRLMATSKTLFHATKSCLLLRRLSQKCLFQQFLNRMFITVSWGRNTKDSP